MAIEFHCEHCEKLVRAPDSEGGQMGKCPFCKGRTYIPAPVPDGEIPLVPLDDVEEKRRVRAAAEDAAIQRRLLKENARDRDYGAKPGFKRPDGAPTTSSASPPPTPPSGGGGHSRKQLAGLVVSYIEAMSQGNLDKAEKLTAQLAEDRRTSAGIVDDMMTEDLSAYGLPPLPRPVLLGFLRQLRGKL